MKMRQGKGKERGEWIKDPESIQASQVAVESIQECASQKFKPLLNQKNSQIKYGTGQ